MKLQIRVDEAGIIQDVKFKTFGCGSAIASSSYMTERVKGLSLEDAEKIKNTEIAKELCLPPVKLHCSSTLLHTLLCCSSGLTILLKCLLRMPSGRQLRIIAQSAVSCRTRSSLASLMLRRALQQAQPRTRHPLDSSSFFLHLATLCHFFYSHSVRLGEWVCVSHASH